MFIWVWLHQVLVAAYKIQVPTQESNCPLDSLSLSHWTTRTVPMSFNTGQ